MKERGIIMGAESVRAILAGTKTQTRRIITPQPPAGCVYTGCDSGKFALCFTADSIGTANLVTVPATSKGTYQLPCPYPPGSRLYVKETWDFRDWSDCVRIAYAAGGDQREVKAPDDWNPTIYNYERWRSPLFMPRWASRITLEVDSVRVERLQDISEADAKAEGMYRTECRLPKFSHVGCCGYRRTYEFLWETINGKRAPWADNCFVWVIGFHRV